MYESSEILHKLRVLQTLSTPQGDRGGVSGPEIRTRNLLPLWKKAGVEIVLGYPPGGRLWEEFLAGAFQCVPFRLKHRFDALAVYRAFRLIRTSGVDVIHNQGPPPQDFVMALAAKWAGVPMVFTRPVMNEDLVSHSSQRRALYRRLDHFTFRWTDAVIAVSDKGREALLQELPAGVPEAKVKLIYNGVDLERFRPRSEGEVPDSSVLTIGMVAQLAETKGWDDFLKVVAGLVAKGHSIRAVACGEGPEREKLERMRNDLGLEGIVEFYGLRRDTPEVLREFDLFLFPSRREGLSVAILEAMATGLPVVATDVGATREQVTDGWNGYICTPGDVDTMIEKTDRILKSPEIRTEMGAHSRERAEKKFSETVMFQETWRLYRELVNINGHQR